MNEMVKLLNVNCMDYIKECTSKEFDIAIIDPPYGINEDGGKTSRNRFKTKQYDKKNWDSDSPEKEFFDQIIRISKNQIIFGANHFIEKINRNSSCWIVWDKDNGECDFADCELAWTSFNTAVRRFKYRWAGMIQGDMKNKEIRIHPTQKPVKLYQWILANYAKPGMRIIDTHLGSGSSAIAAYYFGCEFVGCELDEEYYFAAKERFERETRQATLL